MGNILKQLMKTEFGEENYKKYCRYISYEMEKEGEHNPMIYDDMYRFLQEKDQQSLLFMKVRLNLVILQVFQICKEYSGKLLASLFVLLMIFVIQPVQPVFALLITLAVLGLGIQTYRYSVNKHCYVDMRIAMIYKNVLDRLCP